MRASTRPFVHAPEWLTQFVARRLRKRRHDMSLSLSELSARTAIAESQLQKFEAGVARIPAAQLSAIAGVLQVKISYFFDEEQH
jgi:transcriptional regulator with XRE-family HTH domain